MVWKYFRITGYIGIEDGLGLYTLEIPFDKCKNNLCLIIGKNGSGKSTLQSALSPLPDSSTCFSPNKDAAKEGILQLGDGTEYHFLITSPVDAAGNRKQTKAFIKKNGVELNTNGNVTSYKEIIETEFDMDPNFMTLTRLSSEDRGIADKKPAERKKYVSYNMDSLETYNRMNKVLSKKSSIFKSHINSIASKINSVGDIDTARMNLQAIEARIVGLDNLISDTKAEISRCESIVAMKDKDGNIQNTYTEIANKVDEINYDIDRMYASINQLKSKHNIDTDNIDKEIDCVKSMMNKCNSSIEDANKNITHLLSETEELSQSIALKQQRLDSMKTDFDLDNLLEQLEKYSSIVEKQEEILKACGLYGVTISKEEYLMIFMKMKQYREEVFSLIDIDNEILSKACDYATKGDLLEADILSIDNFINETLVKMDQCRSDKDKYTGMLDSLSILEKRPSNCKIDTCAFISKALQDVAQDPVANIERLENEISEYKSEVEKDEIIIAELRLVLSVRDRIRNILNDAKSNEFILSKFHESYIFLDENEFLKRIMNHNSFNEVEDCDKYIRLADSIDGYNNNKSILNDLLAQKKIHDSKAVIMEELSDEISELFVKLSDADKKIKDNNEFIRLSSELLRKKENDLAICTNISDTLLSISEKSSQKRDLKMKYMEIKKDIEDIREYIDRANRLRNELNKYYTEIEPLKADKDKLKYAIQRADEYSVELEEYQSKYNTIEVLKKHSSPSSGIQTLYMSLYMNKTLSLANDLLKLMFGGYLELMPYVINQDEFRIPVKHGNGLISDDISSCSTAQICMISMVTTISLSLQSSGIFNIFRFDEIDGGLDTDNRLYFFDTIKRISNELGIDQMIAISHSIESNTNGVDLILLALPDSNESDYSNSNIIYDYRRQ